MTSLNLCSTHMQDLQEVTQEIHYENFRSEKLAEGGSTGTRKLRSVSCDRHVERHLVNWGVLLYLFAWRRHWCFSQCIPWNYRVYDSATLLDTYHLKMTPLSGYWDADHDRPRTRNTRPSNAQCTDIFINKSPTFSLRMSILLLASVILAPNRKYRMRYFSQKTPVVLLCEWINRRAKCLNCKAGFGEVLENLDCYNDIMNCSIWIVVQFMEWRRSWKII